MVLLVMEQEPTKFSQNSLGKNGFSALTLTAAVQSTPNFAELNFERVHMVYVRRGLGSQLIQKKSDPVKI